MTATLVLLRHGESEWNRLNLFTGWRDVDLSEKGVQEAKAAGSLLKKEGLSFDAAHSSVLLRAVRTLNLALDELGQLWLPVSRSWRLNERHYGALQGLDKKEIAERYGAEQVRLWRRSYDVPPPPLEIGSPEHPHHDPRYRQLAPDVLPTAECLKDVVARVVPYWHDRIVPELRAGLRVIVAAHGNSLRALVKYLDHIADDDIPTLNIPTGIPLVYQLDDDMRPAGPGRYLGDAAAAKAAAEAVARQAG